MQWIAENAEAEEPTYVFSLLRSSAIETIKSAGREECRRSRKLIISTITENAIAL
jgi:hypothetical protein